MTSPLDIAKAGLPEMTPKLTRELVVYGLLVTAWAWIFWAMGAFAFAGFPGLARAGTLDEVLELQKQQLRIALPEEICRLYFLRMEATGPAYVQFNTSYLRRQEEFAALNEGDRYDVDECVMERR